MGLALGRLDRGVDLADGHVMALAVELEMVDSASQGESQPDEIFGKDRPTRSRSP